VFLHIFSTTFLVSDIAIGKDSFKIIGINKRAFSSQSSESGHSTASNNSIDNSRSPKPRGKKMAGRGYYRGRGRGILGLPRNSMMQQSSQKGKINTDQEGQIPPHKMMMSSMSSDGNGRNGMNNSLTWNAMGGSVQNKTQTKLMAVSTALHVMEINKMNKIGDPGNSEL